MNDLLLKTFGQQLGVKEISGVSHNPTIVQYFQAIGLTWISDDETPWCAAILNWVLMMCGLPYLKSARAADFLTYGTAVMLIQIRPGDIVVFKRKGGHHVGLYTGHTVTNTHIWVMGGNQGNKVGLAMFDLSDLVGIRRVSDVQIDTHELPEYPLHVGDKGKNVEKLQALLKYFVPGVYAGKIDGAFGPNTKLTLEHLQEQWRISSTGIYDKQLRDEMFSRLNA